MARQAAPGGVCAASRGKHLPGLTLRQCLSAARRQSCLCVRGREAWRLSMRGVEGGMSVCATADIIGLPRYPENKAGV